PGPHNNSNNATPEPAEPKGERDGRATPGPGEPTGKRGRKARLVHGEPSKKNGSTGLATLQRGPTKNAGLEPGEPTSSKKQRATLERGAPSKQRATPERGEPSSGFEQAFRNIDDALWKDPGCTSELDYTEQTSWILFLKYLDDLESVKQMEAELKGQKYTPIIEAKFRWPVWACPKGADGKLAHHTALSGMDLVEFVHQQPCPYLGGVKPTATGPDTIEYKVSEISGETNDTVRSGYTPRDVPDPVD